MGTERTNTPTPSTTNRRRYPRAPLSLLVQFRFNTVQEFLMEYATNLSFGGMFIRTTEPREIGTLIYFQFTLKDGSKLIEGLGRVVHSSTSGMGVEFVSVLEPSASIIRKLVSDRLASSRA